MREAIQKHAKVSHYLFVAHSDISFPSLSTLRYNCCEVRKEMSGNNLKVSGIINLPSLGSLRGKLLCPEQYIEGFASVPVGIVENRPRVPLLNSIEPSIGWSHPLTKKGDACSLPTWQANLVEEPSNT